VLWAARRDSRTTFLAHVEKEHSHRRAPALLIAELHRPPPRTEEVVQSFAAIVRQFACCDVAKVVNRVQRLSLDFLSSNDADADEIRRHYPVATLHSWMAEDEPHEMSAAADSPHQ
jgi:DNA polymerase IIIc chi subunit